MAEIRSTKELLRFMKVMSNPVRVRILASLEREPKHIYALAKELKLSYPLVHLYLESLERAGLVNGNISAGVFDERERKTYHVVPFELRVTPALIRRLEENENE